MISREGAYTTPHPCYRRLPRIEAPGLVLPASAPLDVAVFAHTTSGDLFVCGAQQVPTLQGLSGGILADAPGLGKTIEVLALISTRPRPRADDGQLTAMADATRFVPEEWATLMAQADVTEVLRARATLIVSPAAIVLQWVGEIKRHAPTLRVAVYHGMGSVRDPYRIYDAFAVHFYEAPTREELAAFDIVLTAYEV